MWFFRFTNSPIHLDLFYQRAVSKGTGGLLAPNSGRKKEIFEFD